MLISIKRTYHPGGTNGDLYINDRFLCHTIELPWKDNQPRRSCIPEGLYLLKKRFSPKHRWHLEVLDVSGRALILVHPANDAVKELKGCIAPVNNITGEGRGSHSRIAFQRLINTVYPALKKELVYLSVLPATEKQHHTIFP